MVVSELRGEKIDIIPWNPEPARFIAKALSPARVREVLVDDEARQATVIVPDDQLALAIGREGQNARLAARLTGWRIDIRSATEMAEEFDGEETGGSDVEEGGRSRAWQVRRQQRLAGDDVEEGEAAESGEASGESGAEGETAAEVVSESADAEPVAENADEAAAEEAPETQAAEPAASVAEGDPS
jgi:N utilization substance protein A